MTTEINGTATIAGRSRGRRWVGIAANLLFLIGIVFVFVTVGLYIGLQAAGYRFYAIKSPSMEPAFTTGDVVAVKSVAPYKLKQGDVIAFHKNGASAPVVHRVEAVESSPDLKSVFKNKGGEVVKQTIQYSPRTYYTKGDANPIADQTTTPQAALIGEVQFVVPWPFNLAVTAFNRATLMWLGTAAIAAFVAWEGADALRRALRKRAGAMPDGALDETA